MKTVSIGVAALVGTMITAYPVQAQSLGDILKREIPVIITKCVVTNTCRGGGSDGNGHVPKPTVRQADEAVRADQAALNYFGFQAGTPDGYTGQRTRNAIRDFQAYMNYPVTGQLNDWERGNLQSYYHRAQSGGAYQYSSVMQSQGPRGLLRALDQERVAGVFPPVVPAPEPIFPKVDPVPEPPFPVIVIDKAERSMAQHCGTVDILTQANGQAANPDMITDPAQALDEQFCGSRGYAMSRSQQLAGGADGTISAANQNECAKIATMMAPYAGNLADVSPAERAAAATAYANSTKIDRSRLQTIAEVCLGVGYQTDNADVALASAMLLVGIGEGAYGETIGHHLRRGFGAPERPGMSTDWYRYGLDALDNGAAPAFLPAQSAYRTSVIRAAISASPTMPGAANINLILPEIQIAN
ncbi:MAG: peptidoglycan-binding protein [Rhodobacteraceae bacterium]|nr:peptidoglycan-binding protein [Paracoccaceae bacterium]